MILPDFNLGTWRLRYQQGFTGATVGYFDKAAIDSVTVPYTFTEQYIRVLITSDTARQNWKRAGNLIQTIPTFLGNNDVINIKNLSLRKPQIFDMLQFDDGYKLTIEFYRWIDDVDIRIDAWTL